MRPSALPLLLLPALAACSTSRAWFAPRENVRAESPRGYPAASYDIAMGDKTVAAKVWSEGAYYADVGEVERALVHLGLEVDNRSGADLSVDTTRCRLVDLEVDDQVRAGPLQPIDLPGQLAVPAGKVGLIDLEFALPEGVRPGHLRSFRAEWNVAGAGEPVERSTPFRRASPSRRPYYYDDYYWGPGWYGYSSVRIGLFGHYHHYPRSRFLWGPGFCWW